MDDATIDDAGCEMISEVHTMLPARGLWLGCRPAAQLLQPPLTDSHDDDFTLQTIPYVTDPRGDVWHSSRRVGCFDY